MWHKEEDILMDNEEKVWRGRGKAREILKGRLDRGRNWKKVKRMRK